MLKLTVGEYVCEYGVFYGPDLGLMGFETFMNQIG